MKKIAVISLFALISIGCSSSAPTQVNTNSTVTASSSPKRDEMIVTSHSTEKQTAPANQSNSNTGATTSPMQKAVDVSELTANIEKAEKEFKVKPTDAKAKESLAIAYFERAFVLTKASQYSAALGDFRKGLKLKPDEQEAKEMHDRIISIYQSMKREVPKEGQEPPPLPIEKSN